MCIRDRCSFPLFVVFLHPDLLIVTSVVRQALEYAAFSAFVGLCLCPQVLLVRLCLPAGCNVTVTFCTRYEFNNAKIDVLLIEANLVHVVSHLLLSSNLV